MSSRPAGALYYESPLRPCRVDDRVASQSALISAGPILSLEEVCLDLGKISGQESTGQLGHRALLKILASH
ncbi:hypothetical protein PoB_007714800 [Plakobranchus ocellatus]|uniref:Uncharacterized protein n=1 Tax=Plakobranchus ocellatus TaxID=259542 RepID=A0AAV4E260_9GAST|nr:hypothetical protein PoB_007714800 [Plakobranchus ocellatus]